jgi:hypothetical protein
MRFYNQPHRFYAGIDLHARTLQLCVLDQAGSVVCDKKLPCHFDRVLEALAPFRDDLVVGVECMFGWYWLADRCSEHHIPFVLGHALYMKDNDGKIVREFDAILRDEGIEVREVVPLSPNLNAVAERFVQTIKSECLSHVILFGEDQLRYIINSFLAHYHKERVHQGKDNWLLDVSQPPPVSRVTTEDIVCEQRPGGLLKHYRRAA